MNNISFTRFVPAGPDLDYLRSAFDSGAIGGDAQYTKKCERILESEIGVRRAFLTTSCTHALEMSSFLLDIKPGDRVLVPSYTFVSSANAFVCHGAVPVFLDIRPDTINLNEELLEDAVQRHNPKAIVLVHYGAVGCEMDAIMAISKKYGVPIVEDHAHGPFATYKGRKLGTFGPLATLSFHVTKNFSCGEGGALLVNDESLVERAEILREKGTNRSRFFRGEVDKYTWVDHGSSYPPSDLLAAILLAQLQHKDQIQAQRHSQWAYYASALADWADSNGVRLPHVPAHCEHSAHVFYVLMPDLESRTGLIQHLKEQGIQSAFHYVPLHTSDMGQRFGGKPGDCPVAEKVSDTLLRLPLHRGLSEADLHRVVTAVQQFSVPKIARAVRV